MNTVDGIARRNAERAVMEGLAEVSVAFSCKPDWLSVVTRHFMGALVGSKEVPKFTADQIKKAFDTSVQECTYTPKPVDLAKFARSLAPLPAMQKAHSDPSPRQEWTPEERAANIAKIEAMQAKLDELDADPEYRQVLAQNGYGSPELAEVHGRHRAAFRAWVERA